MSDLAARIKEAAAEVGGLNKLSALIEVPRKTLGNWLTGSAPKPKALEDIARVTNTSLTWLVTGRGDKRENAGHPTGTLPEGGGRPSSVATASKLDAFAHGSATFKLLPFEASAGSGRSALTEVPIELEIEELALKFFGLGVEDVYLVTIRGDSMWPTLQNGDVAIVDRRPGEVRDGSLYALAYDGEIFVKRAVEDPDAFVWSSDNPAFESIRVTPTDLEKMKVIGRVIWYWRRL